MKRKINFVYTCLLFLVTAVLLAACLGGINNDVPAPAAENAPAAPLSGEVTLQCNQACADRGQCGTLADGRQVVLGLFEGPAIINHNLTFAADAKANVQASSTNVVETIVNPTRSEQTFYLVTLIDNSKSGWVAGWCVAQP